MANIDRRAATLGVVMFGGTVAVGACGSRTSSAQAAQGERVRANLYDCEGCAAAEERSPATLFTSFILAGPDEPGERMRLSGRVLAVDGVTPVEGIVIYAHQTNVEGLYANGSPESEWSRRNGRIRGWAKTDSDGLYTFHTIKPAPYPDMTMPAHIHLYVKEPGQRPYYVDDVVFEGEFRVDAVYKANQELRGGSGIVRLERGSDGVLIAVRDIRLERHPA